MIDWKFIGRLEGRRLHGYVPDVHNSWSGVTIATGCDLGHMPKALFETLSPALQSKLKPYLGLTKFAALTFLQLHPLSVTDAEADELDAIEHREALLDINHVLPDFHHYSDAAQTVISSVTIQYGSPWKRCPHFWAAVEDGDVPKMVHLLRNFGDHYQPRHDQEADYLQEHEPAET